MEETLQGFNYLFGQGSGRMLTLDQAIVEAATAKAAQQEAAQREAIRREQDARHEAIRRERENATPWRVVDDPNRLLLESGQVAYRKAMHNAAIQRRMRELESGDGCILLAAPVERIVEVRR